MNGMMQYVGYFAVLVVGLGLAVGRAACADEIPSPPEAELLPSPPEPGRAPSMAPAVELPAWHHPDLAKAIAYDDEVNAGKGTGNQLLAEKHYLAYLGQEQAPDRSAWAYTQLGLLFSTNVNADRREKPDFAKARRYFAKAIELQPEAVNFTMLRARLGRAVPMASKSELLEVAIDGYKWMKDVQEGDLKKLWSADFYPPQQDMALAYASFKSLFDRVWQVEGRNLVHTAMLTDDRLASLRRIGTELPNTPAAAAAQAKIDALTTHLADRTLDHQIAQLQDLPAVAGEAHREAAGTAATALQAGPLRAAAQAPAPQQGQTRSRGAVYVGVILGLGCVCALALYLYAKGRARQAP
jgi:hypothetical protein